MKPKRRDYEAAVSTFPRSEYGGEEKQDGTDGDGSGVMCKVVSARMREQGQSSNVKLF